MPRVNIYIRKENAKAWEQIADKSAWVNELLNRPGEVYPSKLISNMSAQTVSDIVQETVTEGEKMLNDMQDARDYSFCEHEQVKGFCKKGCK